MISEEKKQAMTVSVVTPSYNQGEFVEETIRSVLEQEGDFNIDYIIMDGGSKDNSVDIIKKYDRLLKDNSFPVKCRNISYRWVSKKDGGHIDALQKGFAKAEGEIGVWLNSDDIFHDKNVFESVVREFGQDSGLQMLTGDGPFIDKEGREFGLHHVDEINFTELLYLDYHILQPATFVTKELYKNEQLDTEYGICFDAEYFIRLICKGYKYKKVNDRLACFRLYPETRTLSSIGNRYKTSLKISETYGKNYFFYAVSALYKYFEIILQNRHPDSRWIRNAMMLLRMISYRVILGKRHRYRIW